MDDEDLKKTITIGKTYITQVDAQKSRLCTSVSLGEKEKFTIWYEVQRQYEEYLCVGRADAFVVNILLYAMEHEFDIFCIDPMSERLYYQLVEYLIPTISSNIEKYNSICINAELTNHKLQSAGAVGGSLSGGVDSFYTIFRHCGRKEVDYNLTHLTFFNAGQSGDFGGENSRKTYLARIGFIKDVAEQLNLPLVCVDTNINEFLQEEHESTHTMRTLAIPLALQKLFSKYYFASGFPFTSFAITEFDTAPYDLLNLQMLSTENISFYPSGGEVTRLDKVKYISEYEITYPRLNVCVSEDTNCSRCLKCQRTMVELYVLGKLELYKNVFDVEYFYANKTKYMITAFLHRNDYDWCDVYPLLKKQKDITIALEFIACVYYVVFKMKKATKKYILFLRRKL